MFNHLFNTYEAVTPPPRKSSLDLQKIQQNSTSNFLDNIIPTTTSLSVNKPLDEISEPSNIESENYDFLQYLPENYLENSITTNQDIKKPQIINSKSFDNKEEFVKTLNSSYRKALEKKGLNPDYSYILTAQAALESNWGKSQSGKFNFGGIKATGNQKGTYRSTREYDKEKGYYTTKAKFRDFDSIQDYCDSRIALLSNKRYNVFNQYSPNNPQDIIYHVVNRGYATAPAAKYTNSVMQIYNQILNILNI